MTNLPKSPFNNLALSLSGGGYRAAAFHLGLLKYLSKIKWQNVPLLERVRILSTVSGGTFTGVTYSTTIAEGKSFDEFYKKLFDFLQNEDLLGEGLSKLSDYQEWRSGKGRSLINAFSKVYFEKLEQNNFEFLYANETHLKEIIFNATEFSYGLPFRFQKTELSKNRGNDPYYGNRQVNIPLQALYEIRLADVIAASSCFPLGFEPINFPDDFKHEASTVLDGLKESYKADIWGNKQEFPIGLMDGGIVDNQGIDSVHWAEKRMSEYEDELIKYKSDDTKAVDLYIISDVSSPFMDAFKKTEENLPSKGFWSWSFKRFRKFGVALIVLAALTFALLLLKLPEILAFMVGIFVAILLIAGIASFFLSGIFQKALKLFKVPAFFSQRLKGFSKLKFGIYKALIKNRISSAEILISDVFMKHIRRREYNMVYEDKNWKTRLIMNAIFELSDNAVKDRKKKKSKILSKELLEPTKELIEVADTAKSMGTTLWFTATELQDNNDGRRSMLNKLIASGQFTACFNLCDYIEKTLWGTAQEANYSAYSQELQDEIRELYECLMKDWGKFNKDPYWMLNEHSK